jgi:C1A family cysteine protease
MAFDKLPRSKPETKMSKYTFIIPVALLTLSAQLLSAAEYATGYILETEQELALADARRITVTSVRPNQLALQRVAAERAKLSRGTALSLSIPAAANGEEFTGIKGNVLEAAPTRLNLTTNVMAYPSAVDNSQENWFPVIKNQGGLGSCAAFSAAYYALTSQVARLHGWNAKSGGNPAHVLSARLPYNLANGGTNFGSNHTVVYKLLRTIGCPTSADFPYDTADFKEWPKDAAIWRSAMNNRIKEEGVARNLHTEAGLANLKQLLADGYVLNFSAGPVSWQSASFSNDPATTLDDAFFAAGAPETRHSVVTHSVQGDINHAMTIVGYNDNIWFDYNSNGLVDNGEKGALRIANSWGTNWGDEGFCWVSYDALKPISGVTGGFSGARMPALMWAQALFMVAQSNYTPSLVAEITVTHGQRNQMSLSFGRGPTSSTTPITNLVIDDFVKNGGPFAINGTTTASEATIAIDLTDLVNTGSGNRWFAALSDSTAGSPGTFSRVRFIDNKNNVTYASGTNPSVGLPCTVDNTSVSAYADNVQRTTTPVGPAGYTWCSGEGGNFILPGTCDVAYGVDGVFIILKNRTGTVNFTVKTFGSDPVPSAVKGGFYKLSTSTVIPVGPAGYTWCAADGESFTLPGVCDVAYGGNGAGGTYSYLRNRTGLVKFTATEFSSQSNAGILKSGFYKILTPTIIPVGPEGYHWCGYEYGTFSLTGVCDLAYGANGNFVYSNNRSGDITFNNNNFGPDPAEGAVKSGFYKRVLGSDILPDGGTNLAFTNWASSNQVNGGVMGDSDNDGIANGIEYALQSNPNNADGPVGTYQGNVLTYKKRLTTSGNTNLTYRIEISSDLGVTDPWKEVISTQDASKIDAVIPKTTRKIFARLRVVINP